MCPRGQSGNISAPTGRLVRDNGGLTPAAAEIVRKPPMLLNPMGEGDARPAPMQK
jgi:hypothetical protein